MSSGTTNINKNYILAAGLAAVAGVSALVLISNAAKATEAKKEEARKVKNYVAHHFVSKKAEITAFVTKAPWNDCKCYVFVLSSRAFYLCFVLWLRLFLL